MIKKFKMEDVDCANCAAKMEEKIKALDGVNDASISFLHQKLKLDVEDDKLEEVLEKAQKAVASVDKGAKILV